MMSSFSLKELEKKIIFLQGIQLPGQKISRVYLSDTRIFNLQKTEEVDNHLRVNSKEIIIEWFVNIKGIAKTGN